MGYLKRLFAVAPPFNDYGQGSFVRPEWADVDASVPLALGFGANAPPAPIATVNAIISVIASVCGQLPREIISRDDGRTRIYGDRYRYLVYSPNTAGAMSGNAFWEAMFAAETGWGNAYAWIDRYSDTYRGVNGLYFLMPQRVDPYTDGNEVRYRIEGDKERFREKGEILHIAKLTYDGVKGMSPAMAGLISHQLAEAAEKQGLTFLRKGATVGGVVETTDEMTPEQVDEFYEDAAMFHSGSTNAGNMMLLMGNKKYQQVGIPPNEAQFLETRQFQREEILSWYAPGLPHHMLGWKSSASNWGTGVEAQTIAFVKFVLLQRLSRVEEVISERFLPPDLRFEFSVDSLLRGDSKARSEVNKAMRQWGVLSADEWRTLEGMPPRDIENDYLQPLNMDRISATSGEVIGEAEAAPPALPPQQDEAAAVMLDEVRCGNEECKSRENGRRGALLAQEVSGSVAVRCRQCGELTKVDTSRTVRDARDLSDALDLELRRRLS